jgi:hypothetical protein
MSNSQVGELFPARRLVLLGSAFVLSLAACSAPTPASGTPTIVEERELGEETPADEEVSPTEAAPMVEDEGFVEGGVVTGRVTYYDGGSMGYVPDAEASVFVVGREDVRSDTDAEGRFTLSGVPQGLQLITAQSPVGNDHEQLTVLGGETYDLELVTYFGMPLLSAAPSGGYVYRDGEPVRGAKVWTVGPKQPILLATDDDGYFGFETFFGPVIAVSGDRWQVADLPPAQITDIHLDREGVVATEPDVPISESAPPTFVRGESPPIFQTPILIVTLVAPELRVAEDCISYQPEKLHLEDAGAAGWLLTDGSNRLAMLDDKEDAKAALALAKRHTGRCFIGRDNTREKQELYILEYWRGDSGLHTKVGTQDCFSYDADRLSIVDEGEGGWLLTDGSARMSVLDDEADAKRALALAERHAKQCFIGRGNTRSERYEYIIEYWE